MNQNKKDIHSAYNQMRDFFMDEYMKRLTPKNPYNIIWFIEYVFNNDKNYDNLKNDCLKAISLNQVMNTKNFSKELKLKLIDDESVIKRVKELKLNYDVDIDSISSKVVRMGSDYLVKELLKMGMNPNHVDQNGLVPIITAAKRKKIKIIKAYFDDSRTDRYVKDAEGNNLAHLCVTYKNWNFLEVIMHEEPELLLGKNNSGLNIFDKLEKVNYGDGIFLNSLNKKSFVSVPQKMKKIFIKVINEMNVRKTEINKIYHSEINDLITSANYLKLKESLASNSNHIIHKNKI